MKKVLVFLIIIALFIVSFSCGIKANAYSYNKLDEIQNYDITIEDKKDGTLDIEYHIIWKVLDSISEGPLTWVKIGTANSHIKNLTILTDNESTSNISIGELSKYVSGTQSCVRVDFKKSYYQDEIVEFRYKINQQRIYTLDKTNKTVEYSFIPGWFDEIDCKNITIKWKVPTNEKDVFFSDYSEIENGYYIWSFDNVEAGERVNINIKFEESHFDKLKSSKQYISNEKEMAIRIVLIIVLVIVFITFIVLLSKQIINSNSDGYDCYSGFTGRHYWFYSFYRPYRRYSNAGYRKDGTKLPSSYRSAPTTTGSSHGGFSSGGHSCACACACACAGGGRAGCSRKDFYNTYPKIDTIIEKLED